MSASTSTTLLFCRTSLMMPQNAWRTPQLCMNSAWGRCHRACGMGTDHVITYPSTAARILACWSSLRRSSRSSSPSPVVCKSLETLTKKLWILARFWHPWRTCQINELLFPVLDTRRFCFSKFARVETQRDVCPCHSRGKWASKTSTQGHVVSESLGCFLEKCLSQDFSQNVGAVSWDEHHSPARRKNSE